MEELNSQIIIRPPSNLIEYEPEEKIEFFKRREISVSQLPSEHINRKYRKILDKDLGRINNE